MLSLKKKKNILSNTMVKSTQIDSFLGYDVIRMNERKDAVFKEKIGIYVIGCFHTCRLSAVHCTTSSSQITMDVYGRFHMHRLEQCPTLRRLRPPWSSRRPFGTGTVLRRPRRKMCTGVYGLLHMCRLSAV